MKNITREWINKANKDLLVAQRETHEKDPVYDAVCFHSQQAVE
jgi:HEPN domain-containing protein